MTRQASNFGQLCAFAAPLRHFAARVPHADVIVFRHQFLAVKKSIMTARLKPIPLALLALSIPLAVQAAETVVELETLVVTGTREGRTVAEMVRLLTRALNGSSPSLSRW